MNEYDRLAEQLAELGIKKSSMFGMPVLKFGRKPICGLTENGVNFRFDPNSATYLEALAIPGATYFTVEMKNGRKSVMKNWVVVPFSAANHYFEFALAALAVVKDKVT